MTVLREIILTLLNLKRRAGILLIILICMCCGSTAAAQELLCTIEVNSSQVEGTNKSVFETLQEAMNEYVNTRKWTNATFAPQERIVCRIYLTVKSYEDDRVKGDLQIQLQRPVYNSTYTTSLFNFKDTKVEFEYREGDQLIFNENNMESNLTALLNFYVYLMLGIDFDSFSPQGGQPYFDKASTVVQMAQSSGEIGWKAFEDNRNRAALLNVFTENNTAPYRSLLYNYHRKGLDEMVTAPDKGRAVITETLNSLQQIYQVAPMSVALTLFRDTKMDELVNLYSKAPQNERETVVKLLERIYPADQERLAKIKNPPEVN